MAAAGWLFVRVVLGVEWLLGGLEKVGEPGWTGAPAGDAVRGFLNGAIAKASQARYPEVPHWFHTLAQDVFLPNADAIAYLVAFGELLIGIGLLVGGLTRLAAFFGVLLNLMFLWAGTSAANPPMLLLGLAIVAFGRQAGTLGIDRWLLPVLGERVGSRARETAWRVVAIVTLAVAAWLALVTVGTRLWLLAIGVALAAWLVVRLATPRAHPRDTPR